MKEKDKKFEGKFEGEYIRKIMTGMEAYRALKLVLDIWSEQDKGVPESNIHWLAQCMEMNGGCLAEWEQSVKKMIEEREESQDALHAYQFEDGSGSLKPCNCCDKCKFKEI
jgi:hypothetical protein